ncbi:MAG: hypothetical protein HC901_00080 [Bdellovibrionaceae bacterium]|nr:hypothetical protein [Pseudobdellovibrionaceae bacterium]
MLLNNLLGERTYNNLWGKHPPFQIDANFGGTSGIAEMLLQSHLMQELPKKNSLTFQDFNFLIHVLPSLPGKWSEGSFSGMRARGGFEVSASWKYGKPTSVTIKSLAGNPARLKIGDQVIDINLKKGEEKSF